MLRPSTGKFPYVTALGMGSPLDSVIRSIESSGTVVLCRCFWPLDVLPRGKFLTRSVIWLTEFATQTRRSGPQRMSSQQTRQTQRQQACLTALRSRLSICSKAFQRHPCKTLKKEASFKIFEPVTISFKRAKSESYCSCWKRALYRPSADLEQEAATIAELKPPAVFGEMDVLASLFIIVRHKPQSPHEFG